MKFLLLTFHSICALVTSLLSAKRNKFLDVSYVDMLGIYA